MPLITLFQGLVLASAQAFARFQLEEFGYFDWEFPAREFTFEWRDRAGELVPVIVHLLGRS